MSELSGELVQVTDDTFEVEVIRSTVPVLVDFYADWCAPCKLAEPVLAQLSQNMAGRMKFAKVNVDEAGVTTRSYGIHSVPTYLFVDRGREKGRELGIVATTDFRERIRRFFVDLA